MKGKRKNYTEEFKAEAVKLVIGHGYKVSEAARNLRGKGVSKGI